MKFNPSHFWYTTKTTCKEIQEYFDKYGDSYTQDVSASQLKQVRTLSNEYFNSLIISETKICAEITPQSSGMMHRTVKSVDFKYLSQLELRPAKMFLMVRAYFDSSDYHLPTDRQMSLSHELNIAKWELEQRGGHVSDIFTAETTHIIIIDSLYEKLQKSYLQMILQKPGTHSAHVHIVKLSWIFACVDTGHFVDETKFTI